MFIVEQLISQKILFAILEFRFNFRISFSSHSTYIHVEKLSNGLLKDVIKLKKDKQLDLIVYLANNVNSKDNYVSKMYKQLTNNLLQDNFISKKEHKVIFNPPTIINRSEIERAINHINNENEKAAEEFYKMNSKSKKDDYQL